MTSPSNHAEDGSASPMFASSTASSRVLYPQSPPVQTPAYHHERRGSISSQLQQSPSLHYGLGLSESHQSYLSTAGHSSSSSYSPRLQHQQNLPASFADAVPWTLSIVVIVVTILPHTLPQQQVCDSPTRVAVGFVISFSSSSGPYEFPGSAWPIANPNYTSRTVSSKTHHLPPPLPPLWFGYRCRLRACRLGFRSGRDC